MSVVLPRGTCARRMRFNAGVFVLVRRFFSIGHLCVGTAVTMHILVKMVAQCWKPRQPEPALQCKAAIVPQLFVGTHQFMRPATIPHASEIKTFVVAAQQTRELDFAPKAAVHPLVPCQQFVTCVQRFVVATGT